MSDFDYSDFDFEAKTRDFSEVSPELTENNSILIKDLPLSDVIKNKLYDYVDYCNRGNDPAICNCSLITVKGLMANRTDLSVMRSPLSLIGMMIPPIHPALG